MAQAAAFVNLGNISEASLIHLNNFFATPALVGYIMALQDYDEKQNVEVSLGNTFFIT